MSIIQCTVDSFKIELLSAVHDFTSDTFQIALYTSAAQLDPSTTVYSTSNEVIGTGYTPGGLVLTNLVMNSQGGVAFVSWDNPTWINAAFTARAALIYNSTKNNRAVMVLDFGSDRTLTPAYNYIQFPTANANNALLRLGVPR